VCSQLAATPLIYVCSIAASVGAIVIEIRGAMRNDFPDFNLYANVCAGAMGLRWVGLTTEGHAPPYTRDPATGRGVFGKWSRRHDYSLATIDAAALISTLELALRGNFTALIHAYARNVTWKDRKSMRDWAETKLALPQYIRTRSSPILRNANARHCFKA